MKRTSVALLLCAVLMIFVSNTAGAITVRTKAADPDLEGEPVTLRLKVSSGGVEEGPSFPLGPVQGTVGETLELGELDQQPQRQAQLLVETSWGSYFRDLNPEALSEGTIDLTVYPDDPSAEVTVARHGLLVQPFPGRIMVREFVVLQNDGDGLAGGQQQPLMFDLPDDLSRVIPGPGMGGSEDLQSKGDQYRYQHKVAPGETIIGFFYMLQSSGDRYELTRRMTMSTEQIVFSIPQYDALSVQPSGLRKMEDGGPNGKAGANANIYGANGLTAGDTVGLTFTGLEDVSPMQGQKGKGKGRVQEGTGDGESAGRPSSFRNVSWPLMLGIGFSLLIFVGSYSYVQYRLSSRSAGSVESDFLVQELARIDQEFEDGAVDEPYYKRTRRRWKEKLQEIESDESPSV